MVSTTFTTSAFAQDTTDVWLILLTIDHSTLSEPIRVVNNTQNITSNSELFVGFPFNITLPDNREGSPPRAQLSIDNVSREIGEAIRLMNSPASVKIDIIRAAAPDTIEIEWPYFTLRNVKWDIQKVTGDLTFEDFSTEPYPAGKFVPAYFPGLF